MMNSIIRTSFILVVLFFSTNGLTETNDTSWYAGVTTGFSSNDTVNGKGQKFGLVGGYQIKDWLSLETEITKHETNKKRYDDSYSNLYVSFVQEYSFAFVGFRATKSLGDVFGFTARLGAGYTKYKSNFEQESMVNVSSAIGMRWNIKRFTLTQELQQIKYPIANKLSENDVSMVFSLTYKF